MGLQDLPDTPVTRPIPVVLRAQFLNSGDKVADEVLASVAVPLSVGLLRSGPTGEHLEQVDLHPVDGLTLLTLVSTDAREPAHRHAWRVAHIPPNQPEAIHLTLLFPDPGHYEVRVSAEHPEAEPVVAGFTISVPADGTSSIEPVS